MQFGLVVLQLIQIFEPARKPPLENGFPSYSRKGTGILRLDGLVASFFLGVMVAITVTANSLSRNLGLQGRAQPRTLGCWFESPKLRSDPCSGSAGLQIILEARASWRPAAAQKKPEGQMQDLLNIMLGINRMGHLLAHLG